MANAEELIRKDGRLRSLDQRDNSVEVLHEYGQNDSIGELDVITASCRSDTVHAIRDSELVRIPAALFDAISVKHPATTVHFMRLIAARVRGALGEQADSVSQGSRAVHGATSDINLSQSSLSSDVNQVLIEPRDGMHPWFDSQCPCSPLRRQA